MAQVPQHLIDEAAERGIVPGAEIETAFTSQFTPKRRLVPFYEKWSLYHTGDIYFRDDNNWCIYIFDKNKERWATVITPYHAKEEEGLKAGDACECGPAMRAAIVELAKELGVGLAQREYLHGEHGLRWDGYRITRAYRDARDNRWITPEAFIAKMRITASKPKPIKIGDDVVRFNIGSIQVGCTTIDNATVKAIAQKLID